MNKTAQPRADAGRRLMLNLLVYTAIRIGLVALIAALILGVGELADITVPLVVAAVFALVIALPLAMLLFRRQRDAVNESIAEVDEARRRRRSELETRMGGGGKSGQGSDVR